MNKKEFFMFSSVVLTGFLILDFVLTLTIYLGNPLNLSFHPVFYQGILFGITLFGCIYYGWVKK